MSPITTPTGEPADLEDPALEDELFRLNRIAHWNVQFDPLEPKDQEVDPKVFIPELLTYLNEALEVKKKAVQLEFVESGTLFDAAYWVFSFTHEKHGDFYVMVVRDLPITDLALVEKTFLLEDGNLVRWTPAQAALLDLFEPKE